MSDDLIKRLENATGPDRELDVDIGCYIHSANKSSRSGMLHIRVESGSYMKRKCLMYTASIDAALTLVPEHYSYELTQSAVEPPRFARAKLWDWRRGPTAIDPGNEWKSEGNQPLVIHICRAALRARAAIAAKTPTKCEHGLIRNECGKCAIGLEIK